MPMHARSQQCSGTASAHPQSGQTRRGSCRAAGAAAATPDPAQPALHQTRRVARVGRCSRGQGAVRRRTDSTMAAGWQVAGALLAPPPPCAATVKHCRARLSQGAGHVNVVATAVTHCPPLGLARTVASFSSTNAISASILVRVGGVQCLWPYSAT